LRSIQSHIKEHYPTARYVYTEDHILQQCPTVLYVHTEDHNKVI